MVWIRDGFETFVLGWAFFLDFSKNWSFLKRLREGALYHLKLWHGSFDKFLFGLQFQKVKQAVLAFLAHRIRPCLRCRWSFFMFLAIGVIIRKNMKNSIYTVNKGGFDELKMLERFVLLFGIEVQIETYQMTRATASGVIMHLL